MKGRSARYLALVILAVALTPALASGWVSTAVPDFHGATIGGGTFRLADEIGRKMIVINFFQTYCGPCAEELPELDRFARAHAKDPVQVIGIDSMEGFPTVKSFVERFKLGFPVLVDAGDLPEKARRERVSVHDRGRRRRQDSAPVDRSDQRGKGH